MLMYIFASCVYGTILPPPPAMYFNVNFNFNIFCSAIMNTKHGLNQVIVKQDSINSIALSLRHKALRTKALVLELLAAVCLVQGGHQIILKAFDNFKDVSLSSQCQGICLIFILDRFVEKNIVSKLLWIISSTMIRSMLNSWLQQCSLSI